MDFLDNVSPRWDAPDNIVACVTTRHGGVSIPPYESFNLAKHVGDVGESVDKNREILAAQFEENLQWQWMRQVHGAEAVEVTAAREAVSADALITKIPELACCVLTADCLPVFFAARNGKEVAVAHAGWRGLVAGILENTVEKLSTPAEELLAYLAPAIGPCHFEVGKEVRDQFVAQAKTNAAAGDIENCFLASGKTEKYMADLYALARYRLRELGLQSVTGGSECTFCDSNRHYSFRREGVTGRMLSLIYIRESDS